MIIIIDEEGKIEKTFDKVKTATHGADVLAYLQNKKIL